MKFEVYCPISCLSWCKSMITCENKLSDHQDPLASFPQIWTGSTGDRQEEELVHLRGWGGPAQACDGGSAEPLGRLP